MEAEQNHPQEAESSKTIITKTQKTIISVWIGFLVFVLVNGFQYGMTWKLYVLTAWFIAIMVTPWRIRKYLLVTLGSLLVIVTGWLLWPESRDGQWKVYTLSHKLGIPTAQAGETSLVEPAELEAVLHGVDWPTFYEKIDVLDPNRHSFYHFWRPEENPRLSDLMIQHEKDISRLMDAAKSPAYHFKFQPGLELTNQVSREIYYLMMASRMLCTRANLDAGTGSMNKAVERYCALIQIGDKLCKQKYYYLALMGSSIKGCGLGGLREVLMREDVDEKYVMSIEAALDNPSSYTIPQKQIMYLEEQKYCSLDIYARQYFVNDDNEFRFNMSSIWKPYMPVEGQSSENAYLNGVKSRVGVIVGWLIGVPECEEILKKVASTYEHYIHAVPDGGYTDTEILRIPESFIFFNAARSFDASLLESIDLNLYLARKIRNDALENQTKKAGLRLLCLLWRFHQKNGAYPDTLTELAVSGEQPDILIDPCNGDRFVYAATANSLKLYSKGINGVDDGGERGEPILPEKNDSQSAIKKKISGPADDDIMIWPRRDRTSESIDPDFLLSNAYE